MCICDCYGSADDLRVIVRVQTKPALWLYVGQYDARPSDPFSTQEWAMQSDQVRPVPPAIFFSDERAPS